MPTTWNEVEEEGIEPPRHRVLLREQRSAGLANMEEVGEIQTEMRGGGGRPVDYFNSTNL